MSDTAEKLARALLADPSAAGQPAMPLAQPGFAPPPNPMQNLLRYLQASASPEQAQAAVTLPLYGDANNDLTLRGAVMKPRGAPAQPSARLTYSHRF